jgi:nitrate reductase molybdenum cofactor assembly chaperone NarJ/NarW
MDERVIFEMLADLLRYPGEDYLPHLADCARVLAGAHPDAALLLAELAGRLEGRSVEQLQELFIQTFDLSPVCSLELGWHLFGENYDRGTLLVKMRQELRRYHLPESEELPDHLTHALALLSRMEPERAEEFAAACVLPALAKMLEAIEGKDNPLEAIPQAIARVLQSRYAQVAETAEPPSPLRVLP